MDGWMDCIAKEAADTTQLLYLAVSSKEVQPSIPTIQFTLTTNLHVGCIDGPYEKRLIQLNYCISPGCQTIPHTHSDGTRWPFNIISFSVNEKINIIKVIIRASIFLSNVLNNALYSGFWRSKNSLIMTETTIIFPLGIKKNGWPRKQFTDQGMGTLLWRDAASTI